MTPGIITLKLTINMSYCRTTLFEYQTEEDANELFGKYQANAPKNFPDAELTDINFKGEDEPND